jgi:phosphoribosylaminoimidazole-succinocarboxamide synthase
VVDCNSDPSVAVGHLCVPFKVEMVIRGYMSGHAAREYALGKSGANARRIEENDKFHSAIITPTTKADNGETMLIFQERTFCQKVSFLKKIISIENTRDLFQKEN